MFSNAYVCILSNIAFLKFFAYPDEALDANLPDNIPNVNESIADTIKNIPIFKIYLTSLF